MNLPRLCPKCHRRPRVMGAHDNYTLVGNPACEFCWLTMPREASAEEAISAWNASFSLRAALADDDDTRPLTSSDFEGTPADAEASFFPVGDGYDDNDLTV